MSDLPDIVPKIVLVVAATLLIVTIAVLASDNSRSTLRKSTTNSGFSITVITDPPNCQACRDIQPELNRVKLTIRGSGIAYREYAPNANLVARYNIIGIPTVIVSKGGKEVQRFVGFTSADTILKYLPTRAIYQGRSL